MNEMQGRGEVARSEVLREPPDGARRRRKACELALEQHTEGISGKSVKKLAKRFCVGVDGARRYRGVVLSAGSGRKIRLTVCGKTRKEHASRETEWYRAGVYSPASLGKSPEAQGFLCGLLSGGNIFAFVN